MQATSRLRLGLPVRRLVGGPQMPNNAGQPDVSLSPSGGSYRGRRDVRVHRPKALGRSSPPVPHESFHPSVPTLRNLASHPLRRLRSCPSQRGDNAGSIARHTVSKWRSRRARNFFVLSCSPTNSHLALNPTFQSFGLDRLRRIASPSLAAALDEH
jgi:hypothetical protein